MVRNNTEHSGFVEKVVCVNRVSKVATGGRRFSFSALVVVGDENGQVGYGCGKDRDVAGAVRKATEEARRAMIIVRLRDKRTPYHDVKGSFGSSQVLMKSAPSGTGNIACHQVRVVLEAIGCVDCVTKSFGSSNPYNLVRATINACKMMESPKSVSLRRGKDLSELRGFTKKAEKSGDL